MDWLLNRLKATYRADGGVEERQVSSGVSKPGDDNLFEPGRVPEQRPGKAGGKRDRNRQERTRALCDAALVEFLERGVERVTVDEITKAAGVAKGSFYRYFEDKSQVVEALFSPLRKEVETALDECGRALGEARSTDALTAAYQTLAMQMGQAALREPRLVKLYLQECRGPAEGARAPIRALRDEINSAAVALTEAAHERHLLRELPPRITAFAVVGAVETLLIAVFDGEPLGSPAEATQALVSMVLDGVRKR